MRVFVICIYINMFILMWINLYSKIFLCLYIKGKFKRRRHYKFVDSLLFKLDSYMKPFKANQNQKEANICIDKYQETLNWNVN